MAQSIPGHVETFVTGADLSTYKNRWMKVSADNTVSLATAVTDSIIGVLDDTPYAAAGAQAAVRMSGTAEIVAGAAISAGAKVTTDSAGRAVTATSGQAYFGIAIQAATALADLIEVNIMVQGTV